MMKRITAIFYCLVLVGCSPGGESVNITEAATTGSISIKADIWADNWFAFYLEEELIVEDSVSINTERSFNAESVSFKADFPMQLNFIIKDFRENDTGLEYIGKRNQQMGDGGFIMQMFNISSQQLITASNSTWKCLVTHVAPTDKSCKEQNNPVAGQFPCSFRKTEEPKGWKQQAFDDSSWPNAVEYAAASVHPKDDYDVIDWHESAELIWSGDLETHNTLLCRMTVSG